MACICVFATRGWHTPHPCIGRNPGTIRRITFGLPKYSGFSPSLE